MELMKICVGSVSSGQGLEDFSYHFYCWKRPFRHILARSTKFIRQPSRTARYGEEGGFNLVIIASMNYMTANCPNWSAFINHLSSTISRVSLHNSFYVKVLSFIIHNYRSDFQTKGLCLCENHVYI